MHDVAYWRGGTKAERKQADKALRRCVLAKTDDPVLAKLMYDGVHLGGSPYFLNWYRWGYGWSYERKYSPLSSAEIEQVRKRWSEFLQQQQSFTCPVASLKALSVEQILK
jgi:hypothetical protein